jgi:hypothetical protein
MVIDLVEMQEFVSFDMAAGITGLPAELLRKLVRDGVLTGSAPWRVPGIVGNCDLGQAREIAAQLAAARRFVDGNAILVTEAAEKYGFNRKNIYQWVGAGWVQSAGAAPNGDMMVNEGDIALAKALAGLTGWQQGKPVFPKKPYPTRLDR